MRLALSILLPPLVGSIAFAAVWLTPFLTGMRELPEGSATLGTLFAAWAIPIYPLVTVLHLPVFAVGWAWPRAAVATQFLGMLAIYTGSLVLMGVAWVGVAMLLGDWLQWFGLGVASAAHTIAFLGLRPLPRSEPQTP